MRWIKEQPFCHSPSVNKMQQIISNTFCHVAFESKSCLFHTLSPLNRKFYCLCYTTGLYCCNLAHQGFGIFQLLRMWKDPPKCKIKADVQSERWRRGWWVCLNPHLFFCPQREGTNCLEVFFLASWGSFMLGFCRFFQQIWKVKQVCCLDVINGW